MQRGNVKIENRTLLNAFIYRCENGCKWRALPESFGNWHVIYVRLNRWSANGVLEQVYKALAAEGLAEQMVFALDLTAVKVHPDAQGALKKRPTSDRQDPGRLEHEDSCCDRRGHGGNGVQPDGGERGGCSGGAVAAGNKRELDKTVSLLMDRAHEDDKTRLTAWELRFKQVVPPKRNRVKPWKYDRELYKRRNEIERFFRRIKGFRAVCTRYDKLDRMFASFVWLACSCISLRCVNTP